MICKRGVRLRRDSGLASGISNVTMQISAVIGLAALGTIATDRSRALIAQGHALAGALTNGYRLAFVIAAVGTASSLSRTAPSGRLRRRGGTALCSATREWSIPDTLNRDLVDELKRKGHVRSGAVGMPQSLGCRRCYAART